MTTHERALVDALRELVATARPAFPKSPYRKALDRAKALLADHDRDQTAWTNRIDPWVGTR